MKRAFGLGTVIISGPHPELPFSCAKAVETRENYTLRLAFLQGLFRSVGIVPNGEANKKYFY